MPPIQVNKVTPGEANPKYILLGIAAAELLQTERTSCRQTIGIKLPKITVFLTRDIILPPYCQDRSGTPMVAYPALPSGFKGASLL